MTDNERRKLEWQQIIAARDKVTGGLTFGEHAQIGADNFRKSNPDNKCEHCGRGIEWATVKWPDKSYSDSPLQCECQLPPQPVVDYASDDEPASPVKAEPIPFQTPFDGDEMTAVFEELFRDKEAK